VPGIGTCAGATIQTRSGRKLRHQIQEHDMKNWLLAALMVVVATTFTPSMVEAKRLGGGGSAGMQRSLPARTAPDAPPAKPGQNQAAAPVAPAAAGTAAAASKRSWLGPIAGLAAGLGLAALMSHLGLGEGFANFLMLALLVFAAIFIVRWALRRFAGGQSAKPALATAGGPQFASLGSGPASPGPAQVLRPGGSAAVTAPVAAPAADAAANVPADFDATAFERIAKMIFIRMQAANDAADLNDLRNFTTPELFASLRVDLQERGPSAQTTDVVTVQAEVLDVAQEADRQVVSVRFHGLMREERDTAASDFDEVWHLVKPSDDSRSWAIAGIQQRH
jgi:predicted lipid-binding transport protein (Tim44 family)